METGLHCQVFKFELVNAQTQSVYFPADLDLQSGRTIIKSWILHHLQPLVIGFISVMISFIFNFSRVFSFTDGSLERALIDLVYYWIIKCYINGCCLLFIQPKRWTLADPLFLTAIIEEGKEVKREIEVDGCVIQCPMFYWSLLCLSTSTVGWSKLDCFLLLWLTSAYCEQCFQTRRDIFSRLKWSFCLLALAFPFKMTKFFECALHLSWQVTSVKRNNLQCTVTTLSTTNKGRGRQMALLSLIARTSETAQPSPSMKSCLEGNPLCSGKKNK